MIICTPDNPGKFWAKIRKKIDSHSFLRYTVGGYSLLPYQIREVASMGIKSNIENLRERINQCAQQLGRAPSEISIVATTKGRRPFEIKEAIETGIRIIGENRLQEAKKKMPLLREENVEWHFIGHLQMNKVKQVVDFFDMIQSVDSQQLIEEIDQRARAVNKRMNALLEINIAEDPDKYGMLPEKVMDFVSRNSTLEGVFIQGLMTIVPLIEPEATRPYFRKMRELFEKIREAKIDGVQMKHLSMGMSEDFPIAIEEGATMIRLGRAVFEGVP